VSIHVILFFWICSDFDVHFHYRLKKRRRVGKGLLYILILQLTFLFSGSTITEAEVALMDFALLLRDFHVFVHRIPRLQSNFPFFFFPLPRGVNMCDNSHGRPDRISGLANVFKIYSNIYSCLQYRRPRIFLFSDNHLACQLWY